MKAIFILMLLFPFFGHANEDFRTVNLKVEFRVLECSYDLVYLYPCHQHLLKTEEISFILNQCVPFGDGRFCDSRWAPETFTVEGFDFQTAVIVQDIIDPANPRETTIFGWMKSGHVQDTGDMNFSLYIDSGKLSEPVRVNGVRLAKPADAQNRIYTYTPQLKISPIEK